MLIAAAVAFVAIHLLVSGTRLRDAIAGAIGERPFLGLFSLASLGIIDHPIAWTADPSMLMTSVILVDVWKTTPFMALLILAALQMLPGEVYEAAKVDGIRPWKVFTRITLPLIWPALMVAILFRALDSLRVFDLIYVLTSNSINTMSMSVFARQQSIDFGNVGFGSAASTLLFLIIAVLAALWMVAGRVRFDK